MANDNSGFITKGTKITNEQLIAVRDAINTARRNRNWSTTTPTIATDTANEGKNKIQASELTGVQNATSYNSQRINYAESNPFTSASKGSKITTQFINELQLVKNDISNILLSINFLIQLIESLRILSSFIILEKS